MTIRADRAAMRDLPQPALPWILRRLNARAEQAAGPGGYRAALEPAEILRAVDERLGWSASMPARVHAALERMCASLREDSNLHHYGASYIRNLIVSSLVVRARLDRRFDEQPELERTELIPPLIIVGLQRSGTTLLHRMMAEAEDAREVPLWELLDPVPPVRGPDLRAVKMAATFYAFRFAAPAGIDAMHYMRPHLADECQFMLRLDLRAAVFWTAVASFGYADWLLAEDQVETYRLYRRLLQLLQHGSPGRRLTLKNPAHTLALGALLDAVPEALVVQTHRTPLETLPSQCLLTLIAQTAMTRGVDPARVVETVARMQLAMATRSVEARETEAGRAIVDVDYAALVRDPVATVVDVRARFGLDSSAGLRERLRAHLAANAQHGRGRYRYDLQQFGLDPAEVRDAFAAYVERFLDAS